jgi:diguanylate cyclase (GGDEF)-like protein
MNTEQSSILIVDDNPINIQILNEILNAEHEIFFATNGHDALKITVKEQPDLVLLDIMMPDMDGYEVCRRLKSEPSSKLIPVIFVTAMGEEKEETKGFALGAVDYITKPVSAPIVKARVHTHLQLKRQQDLLRAQSCVDGLTCIANRRRFDEVLVTEWGRSVREQTPLSLIMMDIDFFKQYNDHYGHLGGDDCLKKVAQTLCQTLKRCTDFVARYGGEEFVCLLTNTDFDGGKTAAEKLRKSVEDLAIPHEFSQAAKVVTISLGFATIDQSSGNMPKKLIETADKALYEAKQSGRNRTAGKTL